jgi:hypothetical protein
VSSFSFVSGAALFYLRRFFLICHFALPLSCFHYFLVYKAGIIPARDRRDWSCTSMLIIVPLIMLSLGFYRAASSSAPPPDFEQLSGQEIDIKGCPLSEPVALQSERKLFLHDMEIRETSVLVNCCQSRRCVFLPIALYARASHIQQA